MSTSTLITSRDPKGLHAVSLFEAAFNKSGLNDARAQMLNEHGGEFQDGIQKLIRELTTPNQYANEEVKSNFTYPKEYKGHKPIVEQIMAIGLKLDLDPYHAMEYAKKLPALPQGAEGWFAIPSVTALVAKFFPEVIEPAQQYCRAVQLIHEKIKESRPFYNWREGQIRPSQLRVHARTAHALDMVAEQQKGDILIVACQLGMLHRGQSVRRAREVFAATEFGLTSLAVGSIVLVHPERLVRYEELDMDCSGDEFSDDGDDSFCRAPCFGFFGGRVGFGADGVSYAGGVYGSASAFLPQ